MKRKNYWPIVPLILILGIYFYPKNKKDEVDLHGRKLSDFNKKANEVEGNSKSYASRSIASVKKAQGLLKVAKVMPQKMFKEHIKNKAKLMKETGNKYRSIFPEQGSDFINGPGKYKFLDHYYALKNTPENRQRFPNAQIKLNYLIVESELPLEGLPVVENADTGNLGIFTGVLKVKLHSMQDIDFIIDHNQYQVGETYEHINLVQYQINDVALAIKTYKKLQSHPKAIRASLEILEFQRRAL